MKRIQVLLTTAVIVAFAALLSCRPVQASPVITTGMTQEAVIELKTALGK